MKPNFSDAYLNLGNVYKVNTLDVFVMMTSCKCCDKNLKNDKLFAAFCRPWECHKRPLCAINELCSPDQTMLWLLVGDII